MCFDPKKIYEQTLERMVHLSSTPGWKHYAWAYTKELSQNPTGLFKGLDEDLKARMTGPESTKASADLESTKPHSVGQKSGTGNQRT
jgi:hypothetical protein